MSMLDYLLLLFYEQVPPEEGHHLRCSFRNIVIVPSLNMGPWAPSLARRGLVSWRLLLPAARIIGSGPGMLAVVL